MEFDLFCIKSTASFQEIIRKLEAVSKLNLGAPNLFVKENNKVVGTISDGDIRSCRGRSKKNIRI